MIDKLSLFETVPGYFLWKDFDSRYITGNKNTSKLFGFKNQDQLNGITDFDINCPAAEYADLFIKQDLRLKSVKKDMLILDVHPYNNEELKTLLIRKNLFTDESTNKQGICCYCTEVTNEFLTRISQALLFSDPNGKLIFKNIPAVNYFLNANYDELDLTTRESQCLFYLLRGKTAKSIGNLLNISKRTVEIHINSLKEKTNCPTKESLIEYSLNRGFLSIIPKGVILNKLDASLR